MGHDRRYILALAALLTFAFTSMFWMSNRIGQQVLSLSVTFTGWTNNPAWAPPPNRLELGLGATGRCALFWVTNTGDTQKRVWFDVLKVEQKTGGEWRAFVPTNSGWGGVGGSSWMGGYGCYYAIGVPPGLPTNVTWRLQVRCGRDRSLQKEEINSMLRREFFRRSEDYVSFPSSEVIP